MGGIDALAAVQARIAEIQSRFGSPPTVLGSMPPTPSSSGLAPSGVGTDFASALSNAQDALGASGTVPNPTNGDMRSTAARTQFAADLLNRMGFPQTSENIRAVVAWAAAEGTKAAFNPLATTTKAANTTNFNSVGVKNYATYEDGLDATVRTLRNGNYANILSALANGSSAVAVAQAVADSPWGTGRGVLRVLAGSA